jgi:hypothetical protein
MVSAYFMSLDQAVRADQFEAFAKLEAIDTYKYVTSMWPDEAERTPEHFRDRSGSKVQGAPFP